jgi:hypothetical protein
LIGFNVSPEYALTVEDQPDAKTAWEYFKNLFKGKSNAWILQFKRDLSSLRQKPGELVAMYASRAREVFSELKDLEESVKDDELTFNVLNGLRAEFETAIFKTKRLLGRTSYPTFLDMGPSNLGKPRTSEFANGKNFNCSTGPALWNLTGKTRTGLDDASTLQAAWPKDSCFCLSVLGQRRTRLEKRRGLRLSTG